MSLAVATHDCGLDVGIQQRSGMDHATLDALTNLMAEMGTVSEAEHYGPRCSAEGQQLDRATVPPSVSLGTPVR